MPPHNPTYSSLKRYFAVLDTLVCDTPKPRPDIPPRQPVEIE